MLNSRYSDSLRAGRSGSPILVGTTRLSEPVQSGPGSHPAFHTVPGLSRGVKQSGRGLEYLPPPPAKAEVKEKGELYPHLWALMTCFGMNFTSTFAHFPNVLWW